jgi:16S rRNA U1498 N3-methylase RsmE
VNLFIWPEWWFSDKEVSEFEKNNFKKIYLWDRILRTETVGIVTWFYIVQSR